MRMHDLIRRAAIRLAFVLAAGAGAAATQAADAVPAGAATGASGSTTVQINNVVNGGASTRGRRGPAGNAGPPGPAGASGPAGPPGIVQVVQSCASCASGDGPGGIPYGALLTALIGGLFGVLGLVITKENKISDFRQAWVDALRNDIADFASGIRSLVFFEERRQLEERAQINEKDPVRRAAHREHELEYDKMVKDCQEKAVHAQMRIRLRINAEETREAMKKLNDALLAGIAEIRQHVDANPPRYDAAVALVGNLHELAAPILKAEWKRVKAGEPSYVLAKNVLVAVVVIGAVVLAVVFARSLF